MIKRLFFKDKSAKILFLTYGITEIAFYLREFLSEIVIFMVTHCQKAPRRLSSKKKDNPDFPQRNHYSRPQASLSEDCNYPMVSIHSHFQKKQLNLSIFKIKITFSKILIQFNSIKFLKIQDYFNHRFGHATVNSDSLKEAVALIVSYAFFLGIQSRVDCFPRRLSP